MAWWDKEYIKKLGELGILLILYKRYVDDINNAVEYPGDGCRIQNGRLVIDKEKAEIDKRRNKEEVTLESLLEIGNGIH